MDETWRPFSLKRVMRASIGLLLLPFVTGAAGDYFIHMEPNQILPDNGSIPAGTIVTARKGDVFYRQPVGSGHVAFLISDLSFDFAGVRTHLSKGQALIASKARGSAKRYLIGNLGIFCVMPTFSGKRRAIFGFSEFAGLSIDDIKRLRNNQTQACVVDSDGDGAADKAFLADTTRRTDLPPIDIAPVDMSAPGPVPLPGQSEAQLVFDGMVGIIGNMSVTLQIFENGNRVPFDNGQMMFRGSDLPHTGGISGAKYTILSYDAKTRTARIRIDHPFDPVEYKVETLFMRH